MRQNLVGVLFDEAVEPRGGCQANAAAEHRPGEAALYETAGGEPARGDDQHLPASVLDVQHPAFGRPVQVMEGNFNRMAGVCPWWDGMKDGRPFG